MLKVKLRFLGKNDAFYEKNEEYDLLFYTNDTHIFIKHREVVNKSVGYGMRKYASLKQFFDLWEVL